jgi:hypothetical protein
MLKVNAFWIGPRLGPLSRACLRSFGRHGHPVILHVYEEPKDVPEGIVLADASRTLPRELAVAHRSGSFAFAADRFRYELMARDAGLYVDCDCYCLRPVEDREYIFGWESRLEIGTAVLKLPAGSPLLASLAGIFTTPAFVPPWQRPRVQRRLRWRARLGMPLPMHRMAWGIAGPQALTHFARIHGVADRALPADILYPLALSHVDLLREPGLGITDLATPRTRVVHLWNEVLRHALTKPAPPTSPLRRILEES